MNIDYKFFSEFAKCLKKQKQQKKNNLEEMISKNENSFMAKQHNRSNIRFLLDLIDYSYYINSNAFSVFLDYALPLIQHSLILQV